MYLIVFIIYLYSVVVLIGFIKWMILYIIDFMKILILEKGSFDDF